MAKIIHGTDGNDTLIGTKKNELIFGYAGNDSLYGGRGSDTLLGGDGNDYLQGWKKGNGILNKDVLTGGNGDDTFALGDGSRAFYTGAGFATITDFALGQDTIQLHGSPNDYSAVVVNGNTEIRRNGNLIGTVYNVALTTADFNYV